MPKNNVEIIKKILVKYDRTIQNFQLLITGHPSIYQDLYCVYVVIKQQQHLENASDFETN